MAAEAPAGASAEPLLTEELKNAMTEGQFRPDMTRSQLFPLVADRPRARYGAWYEMVPDSQGTTPGHHGTLQDCIARLADIEAMGFDVVCLTPIHPTGTPDRKGRNNGLAAVEYDPGNRYAIGSAEGGHDAVHPELGTLEDFGEFVAACAAHGLEVALDFAAQCSPDHPWLKQHPQWFKRRPDGSMRYAEDPPAKSTRPMSAQTGRSYGGIAAAREEILRDALLILAATAPNDRCRAGSEVATNVPAPTRLSKYPSARSCAYALSTGSRDTRSSRASPRLEGTSSPARNSR